MIPCYIDRDSRVIEKCNTKTYIEDKTALPNSETTTFAFDFVSGRVLFEMIKNEQRSNMLLLIQHGRVFKEVKPIEVWEWALETRENKILNWLLTFKLFHRAVLSYLMKTLTPIQLERVISIEHGLRLTGWIGEHELLYPCSMLPFLPYQKDWIKKTLAIHTRYNWSK
jgi:hypothetical protein